MRLILCGLFSLSLAWGQEYRVDTAGGPLTLGEELRDAAAVWEAVGDGIRLTESEDSATTFSFAPAERMGPDLISLTLVEEELQGWEVLLHPQLYRRHRQALLHELGLLLGLTAGGEGVMSPLAVADGRTSPTEEDLAALTALLDRVPGDLDGDGEVGLADLAILARSYGERGVNLPADLNGDGEVTAADIETLRGAYRFVRPAAVDVPPAEPD